ncbi:MAG: hypothetical protein AAGA11_21830 [Pseudomonadota bacterium]
MAPSTAESARHVRDGAIDAIYALDDALREALIGLSDSEQEKLKIEFGKIMGELSLNLINPVLEAYPELVLDKIEWANVAKTRAQSR